MATDLTGTRVAFGAADIFERVESTEPRNALEQMRAELPHRHPRAHVQAADS